MNYFYRQYIEGGDRFEFYGIFCGTSLFKPLYSISISNDHTNNLIHKLRDFNAIDKYETTNLLKTGCQRYKDVTLVVLNEISDVLQWHYIMSLNSKDGHFDIKRSC